MTDQINDPLNELLDGGGVNMNENTTAVVDLDCGDTEVPDQGVDLCAFGKPLSMTLTYAFGTTFDQVVDQDSGKRELVTSGTDGDGEVFIRVLDGGGDPLFEGTVNEGESFSFDNGGSTFGSETHVEVYDFDGGALLQQLEFHTSCSQPLAIGDTFGSIALNGAAMDDGTVLGLNAVGDVAGDAGVSYAIIGGEDAAFFQVDPDTGEVSFINPPDYENPQDAQGDNVYNVVVRATREDGTFEDKPLYVCVQDDCIVIEENTTAVVDLDCGDAEVPDQGVDLCDFGKPLSMTLTYAFGTTFDQVVDQDSGKRELVTSGTDGDGEVFIRVLDGGGDPLFEGTVNEGDSFSFDNGGSTFDSATFVEVYDFNGGALLQSIEFHTSCSQPLAIGDTFGSIALNGVAMDDGTVLGLDAVGDAVGDVGVSYEIIGGDDAAFFDVNAETGEVSFINPPDYENPQDADGDNQYSVIVRATRADGTFEDKPLDVCVEDDCIVVQENTTAVVDLDCGAAEVPDQGVDLCAFGKPLSMTLTYAFGTTFDQVVDQDSGKREVVTTGTDGDGEVFIRVLDGGGDPLFEGTVNEGDSFSFDNGGSTFDSATFVEVYDFNGGALLQSIEFHTSCSQPLAIGDTFGSIALNGVAMDDGTVLGLDAIGDAIGDVGVTYAIIGGEDAAFFDVNADTGEVSFINPPDYENPQDADGDNQYSVIVRATRDDGTFEDKPLDVCVEDDCIVVQENTTAVVNLDCGAAEVPDQGVDLCAFGKPLSMTLTYAFGTTFDQVVDQDSGKREVVTTGTDGDGEVFIRVLDGGGDPLFEGTVNEGDSFSFDNGGSTFDSATFVEVYDFNGGALLQSIEFHTSCSQPLAIGDTFGSIALNGVAMDDGTILGLDAVGDTVGDVGVTYAIIGGDDAAFFEVNVDTGEVSFINPPDYENPQDADGDNKYEVVVRATRDDGTFEDKPLDVCVEDDCIVVQENTTAVVDLDCGDAEVPDQGVDLCAFGKPLSMTLTYAFGTTFDQVVDQDSGKRELVTSGTDGDGEVFIRVLDGGGDPLFEGTVNEGDSFSFDNGGSTFDSATFVEVYDFNGGALLQSIEFHTSCSQPLAIGDTFGSIALNGASMDDGTVLGLDAIGDAIGDVGVTYAIIGGEDAAFFDVNADTGEVSFINPPDYENPQDADGDNQYSVIVRATRDDGTFEDKPLDVCVEDDCIVVQENTTAVVDLDCGAAEVPDQGVDLCAFGKPLSMTLTYAFGTTFDQVVDQDSGKREVVTTGTDGDGEVFIRVLDGGGDPLFEGTVNEGDSFSFDNGGSTFDSATFVEVYDFNGGALLQSIEFHTSCSQPLAIGDTFGSIALNGASMDDGTILGLDAVGDALGDVGVSYAIIGGDDAAFFEVNAETGEVSFINPPDYENPQDADGDNGYNVIVRATRDDGTFEDKPVEVCVEDKKEIPGSLSGRYFCDTNDNDVDDGEAVDPGINGVLVELLDASGNGTGITTTTATVGGVVGYYEFTGLQPSTYGVKFTDPNGVLDGKVLVDPNDPNNNGDDANDSDAIGDTTASLIEGIVVNPGEDTPDNDAGVEKSAGSLSGTYFCDDNRNDIDDAGDTDIAGKTVMLFEADGVTPATDIDGNPVAPVQTDANGDYRFDNLAAGDYVVMFEAVEDKSFVDPNSPNGDDTNDSDVVDAANGKTVPVTVNAGEETKDVDAGVEKDPGSLSGTYFCDDNRNDIDDAGDTDIAGKTVMLFEADGVTPATDIDGNPVAPVQTDANGDYRFDNLAAGDYVVMFEAVEDKSFVDPNSPNGDDTNDSDVVDAANGKTVPVTVNAGEETENVDAGVEKILGSLSGRYFCDTDNDDVDDGQATDPGIEGVVVTAFDAAGNVAGTTTTDATGNYTIAGLAAGVYSVKFTDPDGVLAGKTLVNANVGPDDTIDSDAIGDTTMSAIEGIVVTAGNDTPDNDAGAEEPGSLSGTYFCDDNRNDIDDAGDTDIAGKTVMLFEADGVTPAVDIDGNPVAAVQTDANGDYRFDNLAAGDYVVMFEAVEDKSFVDPNSPNGDDTNDSDVVDAANGKTVPVTVNAGEETENVDAGVEKLLGSLSGRYFCDTDNDDVDDGQATDPGIEGVVVTAFDAAGNVAGTTTTDATGNYTIAGLAAGVYSVKFTDPDGVLVGKTLVNANVGPDDTIDSDAIGDTTMSAIEGIVVTAGNDTPDNDAGAEEPGSLSGTYFCDDNRNDIDDAGDTDIAGKTVMLFEADGVTPATDIDGNPVAPVQTDANGDYRFDNLAAGDYVVMFEAVEDKSFVDPNSPNGDDTNDSDVVDAANGKTVPVTVNAGEETENVDAGVEKDPGSLSGRYFCDTNNNDVDDGEATDPGVNGVVVELLDENGNGTGITTTTATVNGVVGFYQFTDLVPGSYGVRFTDPNNVLDGKILVDANVGPDDTIDSDAIGDTTTSEINNIPVIGGQDTPDNDAGAEELGSLSGRYFCDTNNNDVDDGEATDPGVNGVVVELLDENGNGTGITTTTATVNGVVGFYQFTGLEPGSYGVRFTDPNNVLDGKILVDANVGADDTIDSDAIGDTTTAEINDIPVVGGEDTPDNDAGAEELGSLSGRYFCDTNNNDVDDGEATDPGVNGVQVELLDENGNGTGITTTTATVGGVVGYYQFTDLAPGSYGVRFTDPNNVLDDKVLVDPNVGADDTIDSDAIGDTTTSTINDIPVVGGEDTPDNDAGAEELGSLSGRYFCDTNNNDVDDGEATDPGVNGVQVELLDENGNGTGITTTTATVGGVVGYYQFTDLAPGSYGVRFTDPNNVLDGKILVDPNDPNGNGDDTNDSDAIGDTTSSEINNIPVVGGEDTPDNDAGAEERGSLSGRYFCDTNNNDVDDGEVVDPGVNGVVVELLDENGVGTGITTTTATVNGVVGFYQFTGLEAGTYGVRFTDPDGVLDGKILVDPNDPNGNGDDTNDSDAIGDTTTSVIDTIVVEAGKDTPDNDAGAEELGSLSGRYFCDTNNNDVDDGEATDPGVNGVQVELLDENGNGTGITTTTATVGGVVGYYQFTDLAPGSYGVRFTDPNNVLDDKVLVDPNVGADDTIDSDAIGDTTTSTINDIPVVGGEDTPDNDAGAEELGSLSGRYFCDTNNNDVDDGEATDPGVNGVQVELLDENGNGTGITTTTATVGGVVGYYQFTDLAPGSYGVRFTDPNNVLDGKILVDPNDPNGNGDDTNDSDAIGDTTSSEINNIPVVGGEDTPDNDAGAEERGSLSGRYFCDTNNNDVDDGEVVDPGVNGVVVELLDENGVGTGITTTTATVNGVVGFYQFTGLEAGTYGVRFTDPDGVLDGKILVDPNDPNGNGDDTNDSDAIGDTTTSEINDIPVVGGQDTPDNDAGAEERGSLSGRYFCDTNNNDVDDGEATDPGVNGVVVELLDENGNGTGIKTTTATVNGVVGFYQFTGLEPGSYGVRFTDPNNVLDGKILVDANAGPDDTIDSDAIGDTTTAEINNIPVVGGQDTPDNDAGAEELGSLSGRYFCDTNNNDVDDGEATDPGVNGVVVELLDENGNPTGITTITATVNGVVGYYEFIGLAAGTYGVKFTDPNNVLDGKTLVAPNDPNGNGDDSNDSDAIGDTTMSTIDGIVVEAGEDTPDNDAGVEVINRDPEPEPDAGEICWDEVLMVDVLANDSDPDGDPLTITAINGISIVADVPIMIPGIGGQGDVSVTLDSASNTLKFDGSDAYAYLLSNESETQTFVYTVEDGNGGSATSNVDVTFCGETDLQTVMDHLPTSVQFQLVDNNYAGGFAFDPNLAGEAFDMTITDTSGLADGFFDEAYCVDYYTIPNASAQQDPTVPLFDAELLKADAINTAADLGSNTGINGQSAADNMDLVTWIINQDFTSQDNGDGNGMNYTDQEVQAAVWALTNGQDLVDNNASMVDADGIIFIDGWPQFLGTRENAKEILDAALVDADNDGVADNEGFEATNVGDLVGVYVNPTNGQDGYQPFIIGIELEDCIC